MAADWTYIRSTRANPPGRAASHEGRRRDYVAALTQFEQLYTAAQTVGPASRPILLYYGLSQAGRALLAAGKQGQWQAHGHGLKLGDPKKELLDTTVRTEGAGLFQAVSELVRSDAPSAPVEVGALWHALPDVSTIDAERWPSALPVQQNQFPSPTAYTIGTTAISPAFVMATPELQIPMPSGTESLEDAVSILSSYPRLSGAHVRQGPFFTMGPSPFIASLSWQDDSGEARRVGIWEVAEAYPGRDDPLVVPAVGDAASMTFTMIWWVLLYVMSMLARYEPAIWVQALNVDRSPIAVPLEAGLERPLEVVPVLVRNQLQRL